MKFKKIRPILPWLILVSTSLLVFNILFMMNVNRSARIDTEQDYAIFQNDIFQHSLFLNKSIVTIHDLLKSNNLTDNFTRDKKKLDVLTRAILGHQTINIEIYEKIIDRLPADDPLQLTKQILVLRPKMVALVDMISGLNGQIRNAASEETLSQILVQYQPSLGEGLVLLNDALNVHSQVKSTFFSALRENNIDAIEGITLNLRLLAGLILVIIVLAASYLFDQKYLSRLLKEANEGLDVKVRSRTKELNETNQQLQTEISEKRRAEKDLRTREKELRQTLDATTDGIWRWDFNTNEFFFSPKYYTMLGYKPDAFEANYESWVDLIHPDDRQQALENANEYLKTKSEAYENEFRLRTKNGDYRWIHARGRVAERDKQGSAIYMIGHHEDITDRKKFENQLKLKDTAIENSLNAFDIIDENGKFVYVNRAYVKMWGYDHADEIIGTSPANHCVDPTMPEKVIRRLKENGEYEFELNAKKKDGSHFDVLMWARLAHDEQGREIYPTTSIDISQQKKAALEKEMLQKRLMQTQKMESIGNLAGGIAHDFNNILASIIGFTELALDDVEKNTTLEDSLKEVFSASLRAKDLVKQILAFARQSDEELKPIQPGLIAKEVIQFIRPTIPTTIDIQQRIASNSLIMGNATQFHQVLMNLCINAAQSMEKDGGTLDVSISDITADRLAGITLPDIRRQDYVEIKVSDTGVGIPQDKISFVFEPYFTTKAPGEGTGMGLALVQGVVESYGGRINVNSVEREGTTFTIYLPITLKRGKVPAYGQQELPTGDECILFVDDEAPLTKIGEKILSRLGYTVTTCTGSVKAVELFKSNPHDFDLVITDMTMPNMTGDELAIELLSIRRDILIILCTGYSNKISDEAALKIGIKAFAYKPIVKADLAKTVRRVLDAHK